MYKVQKPKKVIYDGISYIESPDVIRLGDYILVTQAANDFEPYKEGEVYQVTRIPAGGVCIDDANRSFLFKQEYIRVEINSEQPEQIKPSTSRDEKVAFVPFEDVLSAMRNGKTATFHHADGSTDTIGARGSMSWTARFSWLILTEGKWTINP